MLTTRTLHAESPPRVRSPQRVHLIEVVIVDDRGALVMTEDGKGYIWLAAATLNDLVRSGRVALTFR